MKKGHFRGEVLENVMPQKVDLIDRKILHILFQNARVSNTAIARTLKLKREVIAYRINQLVSRGIIAGFLTLIDVRKLGFVSFEIYLTLVKVADEKEIVQDLIKRKEVTILSSCSGRYDLFFAITTNTLDEFEEIFNRFIKKYSTAIKEYVILNFLWERPMGNNSMLNPTLAKSIKVTETKGSSFTKEFTNEKKECKVDKTDRKILHYLKNNTRASLKDIALSTHTSPTLVKARMSKLVRAEVIKSFTSLISFSALGDQWFMVLLNLVGDEKKFLQFVEDHPNIEWCVKYIGPWNFAISIFARSNVEFHKILNQIREEFKEEITMYDSILIFNQHKFDSRVY